jgi:DNA-binding XRE family transcriptional regulator
LSEFGKRLVAWYEDEGYDQKTFAAAVGIKPPSLSDIESGETTWPSAPTAIEMARVLKTTVEYLIRKEGPKRRPLDNYPPDVQDLCTLIAGLSPQDRSVVVAMATQMEEVAKQSRIARKAATTRGR